MQKRILVPREFRSPVYKACEKHPCRKKTSSKEDINIEEKTAILNEASRSIPIQNRPAFRRRTDLQSKTNTADGADRRSGSAKVPAGAREVTGKSRSAHQSFRFPLILT
jgi:hypothetical protein